MSAVSGQNNFYKFDLHNSVRTSPIVNIKMHTNRSQVSGNYITLGIPDLLLRDALAPITAYVNNRLQNLGASLITQEIPPWHDAVIAGRAAAGDEVPSYIKVTNYVDARRVIDNLFAHNEMSVDDRADMENALRELEKSARFASKQVETISLAQKDVIENFISPYINDIRTEAPDGQTAQIWIQAAASALSICGPDSVKRDLSSFLWTACESGNGKSDDFYESLFVIAKIYASMGDLEGALEQLGESLPSKSIIQKTILDLFI